MGVEPAYIGSTGGRVSTSALQHAVIIDTSTMHHLSLFKPLKLPLQQHLPIQKFWGRYSSAVYIYIMMAMPIQLFSNRLLAHHLNTMSSTI